MLFGIPARDPIPGDPATPVLRPHLDAYEQTALTAQIPPPPESQTLG
jgi:hypothetical protein